jgi:hypothetical protein
MGQVRDQGLVVRRTEICMAASGVLSSLPQGEQWPGLSGIHSG